MQKLNAVDWLALVLVLVGALNWGLVGLLDFDLVATLFGDMSLISRAIYSFVGIAALYIAAISMSLNKE
ncbi:MAG: DUF378 domain-containing protein [Candidatus Pacebacteria bacterium]|nr:DUF378 domain-containing protein [Candidatus Paceibacterota bacterium]